MGFSMNSQKTVRKNVFSQKYDFKTKSVGLGLGFGASESEGVDADIIPEFSGNSTY